MNLLVRDSGFVSAQGNPATAIDPAGVVDARIAGVSAKVFAAHISAAQSSTVTVAQSDLRDLTADTGSTGYEGLVTFDDADVPA